ncbi:hypothetical protein EVAR_10907_1 [Eumeta japonica]|uniref:Uncharacterized protein n=1 Tax=Eumeta variegata TaxID=151549 RepID=A0A4C1U633_EUMVA|nr:hypothetical protein EVAR_10907_1 [Eumeta japonica]
MENGPLNLDFLKRLTNFFWFRWKLRDSQSPPPLTPTPNPHSTQRKKVEKDGKREPPTICDKARGMEDEDAAGGMEKRRNLQVFYNSEPLPQRQRFKDPLKPCSCPHLKI